MSRVLRLAAATLLFSCLGFAQQYKNGSKPMVYRITELNVSTAALNQNVAYDLNDNAQIAGDAFAVADMPSGFMRDTSGAITWTPAGVNGRQTSNRAFIYDLKTGINEIYGPFKHVSFANGIDESGVAVGQSDGKATLFLSLRAFDLNQMIEGGTPWTLTTAYAINNQGQILAAGTLNGVTRSFLLTPLF